MSTDPNPTNPADPTDEVWAEVFIQTPPDSLNPPPPSQALDTYSAPVTPPRPGPVYDPVQDLSLDDQARLNALPVDTRLNYRDKDCFRKDPTRSGVPGWSL